MIRFLSSLLFFIIAFSGIVYAQKNAEPSGGFYCSHAKRQADAMNKTEQNPLVSPDHLRRLNQYDISYYHLDIAVERTSPHVGGSTLIKSKALAATDTFAFELHPALTIDSVLINGQPATVKRGTFGEVNAIATAPFVPNTFFTARVFYNGLPPDTTKPISGLYTKADPAFPLFKVTSSNSDPFAGFEWFACKQLLTDKIDSSSVWITTNKTNRAGSNGVLRQITPIDSNRVRYEWHSRYPIVYYNIAVAVSNYQDYSFKIKLPDLPDSILVQNYVYNSPAALSKAKTFFNPTAQFLPLFSELFGVYPFYKEKYGHCMTPLGGGMEHQTMTFLGAYTYTIVAHELAHSWFGNAVSCQTFHDVFINEGFATYAEYLALEHLKPGQEKPYMNNIHDDLLLNAKTGTVYVPEFTNYNRLFSYTLTYEKGAALLHTLRSVVNNDSLYFAAIRRHLNAKMFGLATVDDLRTAFETETGLNLKPFFTQWFNGEGYPVFSAEWNQYDNHLALRVRHTTTSPTTPKFDLPLEIKVLRQEFDTDTLIRIQISDTLKEILLPLGGTVTNLEIDPNNWVLNSVGSITNNLDLNVEARNDEFASMKSYIYPNPANEQAIFVWDNPKSTPFILEITNPQGQVLQRLKTTRDQSQVELNLSNFSSGIYFCRLSTGERRVAVQKLVISR